MVVWKSCDNCPQTSLSVAVKHLNDWKRDHATALGTSKQLQTHRKRACLHCQITSSPWDLNPQSLFRDTHSRQLKTDVFLPLNLKSLHARALFLSLLTEDISWILHSCLFWSELVHSYHSVQLRLTFPLRKSWCFTEKVELTFWWYSFKTEQDCRVLLQQIFPDKGALAIYWCFFHQKHTMSNGGNWHDHQSQGRGRRDHQHKMDKTSTHTQTMVAFKSHIPFFLSKAD